MAKFRTRDYSRDINPFTGEPWRTPGEFISDAIANARQEEMERLQRKQAKEKLARMSSKDLDKFSRILDKIKDLDLEDDEEEDDEEDDD